MVVSIEIRNVTATLIGPLVVKIGINSTATKLQRDISKFNAMKSYVLQTLRNDKKYIVRTIRHNNAMRTMTRAHKFMFLFISISLRFALLSVWIFFSSIRFAGCMTYNWRVDRKCTQEVNEWFHAWHYLLKLSNIRYRCESRVSFHRLWTNEFNDWMQAHLWLNQMADKSWAKRKKKKRLKANFILCDKERKRQCSLDKIPSHAQFRYFCSHHDLWFVVVFFCTTEFQSTRRKDLRFTWMEDVCAIEIDINGFCSFRFSDRQIEMRIYLREFLMLIGSFVCPIISLNLEIL